MGRDPLYGIRLKLDRAKQQLHSLSSDMDFFHKTKPYGFAVKFNEDVRALIVIAQVEKECPGIWGVQFGEIVHNLRSTLDHLVWELIVHHTGSHPTSNKTQFKTEAGGQVLNFL